MQFILENINYFYAIKFQKSFKIIKVFFLTNGQETCWQDPWMTTFPFLSLNLGFVQRVILFKKPTYLLNLLRHLEFQNSKIQIKIL